MHINSISCGQGAPSLALIVMAGNGLFPAEVVIVADTGWENDMLWTTGERTTAKEFFERVTKPLAQKYNMDAAFVRTKDQHGQPYDPIPISITRKRPSRGSIDIPLFGSNGGRLYQACTSKWKIQAIHQELRRRGAITAICAIGLHCEESHRVKPSQAQWVKHIWPLLNWGEDLDGEMHDLGIGKEHSREQAQDILIKLALPYLVTTECDGCPHKNWERWNRTSPETLAELAEFENQFQGEFFLTNTLLPLPEGIAALKKKKPKRRRSQGGNTLFDSCDSGFCFV